MERFDLFCTGSWNLRIAFCVLSYKKSRKTIPYSRRKNREDAVQ